ncbi:uncharacterized protein LOC119578043 isoform X2 [Penaeus monodon]|nr:uncharacterized protein LOC119578043 isoform X2 [Penaeus monodon]XP_037781695.1 uncharacterized protein LOC119578043 isoform X2 [Penaeus monodon]
MISRHKMWPLVWAALWAWAAAQYIGEEGLSSIQKTAVIGGAARELDQIGPKIFTNRTNTTLNCASGSMLVDVEFYEPFYGIIYPNGSRNSACKVQGHGKTKYHLDLPLKGCGTKRVERRVFVNNIIVRFHPGLELEGDEVKTIICRYPSPEVIPPPPPPVPIKAGPPTTGTLVPVSEVEILLIICAIVFLALLLVGMACSYTCLKKRNIRLVKRRPMSLGAASDITKMSGSSLIFDGVKIPRAHATSTSDSDTALVSQPDTLPSDYPSDPPSSGSEVEEADLRSVERRSSAASSRMQEETIHAFQNQAFIMEEDRLSSAYSDAMLQSEAEMVTAAQVSRPPQPSFLVRVKRAPTPPKTPEPDYPVMLAQAQSLTTILESDESFRAESIPGSEHALLVSESEDLIPPPAILPPPEYAHVHRRTLEIPRPPPPPPSDYGSVARSVSEHDLVVDTREAARRDLRHVENVQLVTTETTDVRETVERTGRRYLVRRAPSEPDSEYPSEARSVTDVVEDLPVVPRPPEVTSHVVDDRHMSTITETTTTEDIERHRRFVKQYHVKPKALPPPRWNVAIRHYPGPKYADEVESSGPEWEGYSEPGSDVFRQHLFHADEDDLTQLEVERLEHPPPPNWNVLLRVLEPPRTEEAVQYVLTKEDREKWRQIISTESTLRTMLTTATVREDFERIRHDQRYEKLFEPKKWDVIIRILSPPHIPHDRYDSTSEAPSASDTESLPSRDGRRYRKNETVVTVRRPSLPPLYEYDSDGNPIIVRRPGPPSARSRRSSKSSIHSGIDVRSMTETEVNFARADTWSEASGPSMARSIADRSQPEMTYTVPVLPDDEYPDTDFDDRMSARTGRSLARSASEFTEDWRHHEPVDRYSHVSESSVGSKRPMLERGVSEFYEEAPHLSDVLTSPDHSPEGSPRAPSRYPHNYQYRIQPYGHQRYTTHYLDEHDDGDDHFVEHRERRVDRHEVMQDAYVVRAERRVDHRSDRSTHSGREEMYSVAETQVSGWARKH